MKKKFLTICLSSLLAINIFSLKANAMPNLDNLSDEEKIQVIDNEIVKTITDIEDSEKTIKQSEKDIADKEVELYELNREYRAEEVLSNYNNSNFLRTNSSTSQFEELKLFDLLFSSKNLGDFFKQIEFNNEKTFKDSKSTKTLEAKKIFIENTQKELEINKETLRLDKEELIKVKEELDKMKKDVEEEIRNRPKVVTSSISAPNIENLTFNNAQAKDILNEAFNYLGVPYAWGGTTPNGFDCSGLVQYVYAKSGINLPRVSESQQNVGTQINSDQAMPGDLLFFGQPAYHVAIYMGDGQYIHAPQTGDVVKISNVYWPSVTSISRILN